MLGGDEQQGVGGLELGFEAGDLVGHRLLLVLVVHGQVVDLDEFGVEIPGAEPHQRLRQLAVDGFAAVGANDDAELEFCHGSLYLWLRFDTEAR